MIQFIVVAAIMVIVGLVALLPPLLRRRKAGDVDRVATNVALLKSQLAELEAERARGTVSDELYVQTKADLDRRVLEEAQAVPASAPAREGWYGRIAAAVIAVAVPVVAALTYGRLGDPAAFDPLAQTGTKSGSPHQLDAAGMEQMVAKLAERLQSEPGNADGWAMLARTYYQQRKFPEAAAAYRKLIALVPDDADVLADFADALAMAQGRSLAGEPIALVKKALEVSPTQWKALAMAGTEAFDRKDFKAAVDYWERLRASLPPESPIAQQIAGSIAEARQLGGLPAGEAPRPAIAAAPPAKGEAKAAAGAQVSGVVKLSPKLAANANPEDIVFIFARAAEGPRMPLAVHRVQVKDLPAKFALDDSMAMSPQFRISNFPEIVVAALVAKGGTAKPQPGDLEGQSKPIRVGASGVDVVIDTVHP